MSPERVAERLVSPVSDDETGPSWRHRATGWTLLPTTRRVHFVGVGGIGMSAVAEMMCGLGYDVSGSDLMASGVTTRLLEQGVVVETGHNATRVSDADVVVVSAAVPDDNPELVEARRRGLPVLLRGTMLAELTRGRTTVAVSGTHGKSTTSSMVAVMLTECALDPLVVVGARVAAFGSNARCGNGPHFVVEADESEPSFLALTPQVACLTNLEEEHLENYGTFDRLRETVIRFANNVVTTGVVVLCADDPVLTALRPRLDRQVMTYALDDPSADVVGHEPVFESDSSSCTVTYRFNGEPATLKLRVGVPGRHNLLNSLAAFTVGLTLGLPPPRVASGLTRFGGIDRRFQLKGEAGGVRVFDDYGHHPTELAAVMATARQQPHERLVVVFQPHRYTRTAHLFDRFVEVLAHADVVVLTEIYSAGEIAVPGMTSARLADAIRRVADQPVYDVRGLHDAVPLVVALARPGDLVLTLGAGSVGSLGERLLEGIRKTGNDSPAKSREGGAA